MASGQAEPTASAPHSLKPWVERRHQLLMLGRSPSTALQYPMLHRTGAALQWGPPGTLATSPSIPAASLEGGLHQGSVEVAPAPSRPSPPGTVGLQVSESPDENRLLPAGSTPAAISLPFPAGVPSRSLPRPSHTCTCAWLPGSALPSCAVPVGMTVPSPGGCGLLRGAARAWLPFLRL